MRRLGRSELKIVIGALVVAWTLLVILGAARASGDGLPVPGGVDTTRTGVLSADGSARYVAVPDRGKTLLQRIDARNGVIQVRRYFDGSYVVPGVSLDGDTAGLSEDESTLVLLRPRVGIPQRSVSLVVVDPATLRPLKTINLRGDFSFDAISPDGRMAYLVQYPNPRDPTDYRLRRLALPGGKLIPGSLLPENDPEEEMRGSPMSRVTGPGGRWEYTLYDGGVTYGAGKPGEPFVHAIDTVAQTTLCIDLDWLAPRALSRIDLRISADGSEVEVVDPRREVVGRIDTATGEAREVSEPLGASAPEAGQGGGGTDGALAIGLAVLAAAGLGLLGLAARRRRGRAGPEPGEAV